MNKIRFLFIIAAILLWHGSALSKDISWDKAGTQKITLFYPGVVSWEFLNSEDHSLGSRTIQKGKKNCINCHLSNESGLDLRGNEIAAGKLKMKKAQKPFEPDPISAKNGFLNLTIQAAYDESISI